MSIDVELPEAGEDQLTGAEMEGLEVSDPAGRAAPPWDRGGSEAAPAPLAASPPTKASAAEAPKRTSTRTRRKRGETAAAKPEALVAVSPTVTRDPTDGATVVDFTGWAKDGEGGSETEAAAATEEATPPAVTEQAKPAVVEAQAAPAAQPSPSSPFPSPFVRATRSPRRLKLLLWGDTGTGKTTLALQFPSPAVIDLEGSTDLYGGKFQFDVLPTTSVEGVTEAINFLARKPHGYRTLVIDPITVLWESLQRKWSDIFLARNKGGKGHKFEFYELQTRDWMTIKAEWKEIIRALIELPMNVIVTARAKTQYAEGGFMKAVGETFDGEKSLPYLFDTIVHLEIDSAGNRIAKTAKDRSEKLPPEFVPSYAVLERLFGAADLARPAEPIQYATELQQAKIRALGLEVGMTMPEILARLRDYGATSLQDLTHENAEIILGKLNDAVSALRAAATNEKGA